ncbi:glycosyl transferase family 8, partial [Staphylococcus aureus]
QFTVPAFWEIKGINISGTINDMGRLRGKIFYQVGERASIVSRFEWFDDQQRVRFVDYYSKSGIKFAQTVCDLNRKSIFKKYMARE